MSMLLKKEKKKQQQKSRLKSEEMTSSTSTSVSAITRTAITAATTATTTTMSTSSDNMIIKTKIENTTEGLPSNCFNYLCTKVLPGSKGKENALTICDYMSSLRSEINPSDHYRKDTIILLCNLSTFFNNNNKNAKPFKEITREDLLSFLDSYRKAESVDPLHKWIGTYNTYRIQLMRFFKWLYSPEIEPAKRPKPSVIENIAKLKRKEKSIYKPTDLWTAQDDSLFLKYCPNPRDRCYHAMSRDSAARPHELLKLRIKDVVFKLTPDNKKQYAEILVNGKTGTRHIPLIDSIPYIKDWLSNHHPQAGNPNSILLCGLGRSLNRAICIESLNRIYQDYKNEFFPRLLDNNNNNPNNILPEEDKQKIVELLKKPWNPYIRRHSSLTEKSGILKEHHLRQFAGWSPGSNMHLKYLHYFGNESNDNILEAYGIITKDKQLLSDALKPKQCPNCQEPNKPDSKFCAKCRMVLTYDAYNETLECQKEKEDQLNTVQSQLDSMQSQIQSLMSAFSNMQEQPQVDNMAKTLYNSGLLVKAATDNNNAKEQLQLIKAAGKAAYHATRTKSALSREGEKSNAKKNFSPL
jgi:integrase/recombinase XerD